MKRTLMALAVMLVTISRAFGWSDYMQAYGTAKTEAISINPGTFSFEVDGVPSGYFGEWYVNNVYKEYDTATLVSDPTYSYAFAAGATQVKCLIYNKSWSLLEAHVWNVTAVLPAYTVNAAAGTGGAVSPTSRTVTQGGSTTFTVTPATGYTRGAVSGDATGGSWSGNTYTTAAVTQSRNLTFSFTVNTYTVSASAGTGGSVSPSSRSVTHGNTTTFTVSPATGYSRGSVSGDATGGSWNGNTYTTAAVTQNRSLSFTFVLNTFVMSASAGTGGSVTPSSRSVSYGSTTTFAVSPLSYYTRNTVSGDASGGTWNGNTYTTAAVTQGRSLSFSFTAWPDLIISSMWTEPANPLAGQNYVIKTIVINPGTAAADPAYLDCIEMAYWVDGVYKGGEQTLDLCYSIAANGGSYTFTSVPLVAPAGGNHTILAKCDWNDSLASDVEEISEGNNEKSISVTVAVPTFTVNAVATTGGGVTPSSRSVSQGNTTTFTVSPSAYYTRNTVSGDASGGTWNGNTYTTAAVTQDRSLSFNFTAWPDLIITSVWTVPANPVAGQEYFIKATVINPGTAAADPAYLDCIEMAYWVDGVYKGGEQALDLCYSIAANGGAYTFTSVPLIAPASGGHTILAKCDWNDSLASDVDEFSEDNNEKTLSVNVVVPTYSVNATATTGGSVTPSSRSVTQGNTTTFTVSPLPYYTRNSVSGDAAGGTWNVNTYTTAPVTQGRSLSFNFTAWPDLVITSLWTEPANPAQGQLYFIKAKVSNIGALAATSTLLNCIEMTFWLDGAFVGGEQVGDLCYSIDANGGAFIFTSSILVAPQAGVHSIVAKADWNDNLASDVSEYNEDNNTNSITLTTTSSTGAKITSFAPQTGLVNYGANGAVTVTMQNTGTTSRAFWVGLSFSGPSSGTWPNGWYDVPPQQTATLAPHETQTINFQFTIPYSLAPGQYTAHAAIWSGYDSTTDRMVEPQFDYQHATTFLVSGEYIAGVKDDPYGLMAYDAGGLYGGIAKGNRGGLSDLETHIANPLVDAKTGEALASRNRRVAVVIPGWNWPRNPAPLREGAWADVTSQLRGNKLSPEWALVEYDWHNDAATGFIIWNEPATKATALVEAKQAQPAPKPNSTMIVGVDLV
ncbi:MAG: CARDB domain-containing protein, partial [bacterium]